MSVPIEDNYDSNGNIDSSTGQHIDAVGDNTN